MKLKLTWGWKYLDWGIVCLGIFVAGAVWFIPSFDSSPDVQAFYKHQHELKAERLAIEAAEARIKKEEDELGLIWVPPPSKMQPAPSAKPDAKAPAKKPAKSAAKPKPKAEKAPQ